ncbi:MAG: hypothetical protein UIL73_01205 [Anaerovoracaceae bacterium]|nr:hypothetical protein [Anaerovoracaceae bacterium]
MKEDIFIDYGDGRVVNENVIKDAAEAVLKTIKTKLPAEIHDYIHVDAVLQEALTMAKTRKITL